VDEKPGRLVIYLVALAAIFVILFGIRGSASILNPILLAAGITITVLPIPGRLSKRGLPGWLSLLLTILAVVLILALVIATAFFSITKLSTELPQYMSDAASRASRELPGEIFGSLRPASTTESMPQLGPVAQGVIAVVLNLLVQFAMALFIFFFMISAAMALPGAVRLGLDPRASIISRISTLTEDVRHYMTILTGINFLVGAIDAVFLWILGVPYALLWGLLAWFMGYIPSIGFWFALIPPVLLAYAEYGLTTALIVFVGYVVINGGVQNFVQPKLMGQGLRISPLVVFIGLFIWGYLLGGIGALLAVPLTILVLTIMENFEGTRTLAILMRYTGEEKKEERKEAVKHVQGGWGKVKGTFGPDREPEDTVREPEDKAE
jgi:predicted PurR-regulated permease PerM